MAIICAGHFFTGMGRVWERATAMQDARRVRHGRCIYRSHEAWDPFIAWSTKAA